MQRRVTLREFLAKTTHLGDDIAFRWFAEPTDDGDDLLLMFGDVREFMSRLDAAIRDAQNAIGPGEYEWHLLENLWL